jgi:hypothetical protein
MDLLHKLYLLRTKKIARHLNRGQCRRHLREAPNHYRNRLGPLTPDRTASGNNIFFHSGSGLAKARHSDSPQFRHFKRVSEMACTGYEQSVADWTR